MLTGRVVASSEAAAMGLADRLCEDGAALDEALVLAGEMARFPQGCMRADFLSARLCRARSLPRGCAANGRAPGC